MIATLSEVLEALLGLDRDIEDVNALQMALRVRLASLERDGTISVDPK